MNNPALSAFESVMERDSELLPVPDLFSHRGTADLGLADVPIERYTSSDFIDLEVEHVWRRVWQMACRVEDIPRVGDHVVYDIVDDSFIIMRTESGEIRAYQNACLHRGRALRATGGTVRELRCPFHGYTWGLDGALKSAPVRWDFPQVDFSTFCLPEAKVATWGGFVFINMDPNCVSLEEYLGVLPEHFQRWDLSDRWKSAHVSRVVRGNWKQAQEAFLEGMHVAATHPQMAFSASGANTVIDVYGPHISRSITPNGIACPSIGEISQQMIYDNYLKTREFYAPRLGAVATKDLAGGERKTLPEGVTARRAIANEVRELVGPALGIDLYKRTDSELIDGIEYFVFPNFFPWGSGVTSNVYRFRPNGRDPDSCIAEVMFLTPIPGNGEHPPAARPNQLGHDEDWLAATELGRLGSVMNQDTVNIPLVQRGMKTLVRTKRGVTISQYEELRIRHFHNTLDKYINGELPQGVSE